MKQQMIAGLALAAALSVGLAQAQPFQVGQDMKDLGHDTAHDTKVVTHKTVHGAKVGTRKTVHGTKVVSHKTAHGTKHVVHKVEGKPTPPDTSPQ